MNPLSKVLDELYLTPKTFSIYYGCPQSSVRCVLSGNCDKIPIKVKLAIERAGYSTDEIDTEYEEWLKTAFRKGE